MFNFLTHLGLFNLAGIRPHMGLSTVTAYMKLWVLTYILKLRGQSEIIFWLELQGHVYDIISIKMKHHLLFFFFRRKNQPNVAWSNKIRSHRTKKSETADEWSSVDSRWRYPVAIPHSVVPDMMCRCDLKWDLFTINQRDCDTWQEFGSNSSLQLRPFEKIWKVIILSDTPKNNKKKHARSHKNKIKCVSGL